MGDRRNVVVLDGGEQVCLYTYNGGSALPVTVGKALARRQRWNDPSYLTRIIFCTMVVGDVGGETGFGISVSPGDTDYPGREVEVDIRRQTVTIGDRVWNFPAYVKAYNDGSLPGGE